MSTGQTFRSVERGEYEEMERHSGYFLLRARTRNDRSFKSRMRSAMRAVEPTESFEKGQEGMGGARSMCAGEPTWMPFFGEKGVQEMEGYR